ncbi:hypothetical protein WJX73_000626 [Symbiochloris irregularis]|uniref:BZIP domain-containing protein n=1 Tax=Symbiochloris irregularis TaxID=706552 RepID=A0AAW1NPW1_9CHLO
MEQLGPDDCSSPTTASELLALDSWNHFDQWPGASQPSAHGTVPLLGSMHDKHSKGKGRSGRPVIYSGDPDAEDLTDQQKREIKRRIGNRESARRMREKNRDVEQCLRDELEDVKSRLQAAEEQNKVLKDECKAARADWVAAEIDRAHLQDANASLEALHGGLAPINDQQMSFHTTPGPDALSLP